MTFDINGVAHTFQIALTPAFLLAGTGAILAIASAPTQGFSILSQTVFDYRFQAVKHTNKNVAHNLCL